MHQSLGHNPKPLYQRGNVSAEFLLVIPTFLFIAMSFMEFSLYWLEHHHLRLAAIEAARNLATAEAAAIFSDPCENQKALQRAKFVFAKRMAPLAEPASQLLRKSGVKLPVMEGDSTLKPFLRMFDGYAAAYLFTDLKCTYNVDARSIQLTTTYYRLLKMPIVRDVFWLALTLGTHPLNSMNQNQILNHIPSSLRVMPMRNELVYTRPETGIAPRDWNPGSSTLITHFDDEGFNGAFKYWRDWSEQMNNLTGKLRK